MATPQETLDQLMQDATDFHSWFTAEEAATLTNSEGVEIKNLAQIIQDVIDIDLATEVRDDLHNRLAERLVFMDEAAFLAESVDGQYGYIGGQLYRNASGVASLISNDEMAHTSLIIRQTRLAQMSQSADIRPNYQANDLIVDADNNVLMRAEDTGEISMQLSQVSRESAGIITHPVRPALDPNVLLDSDNQVLIQAKQDKCHFGLPIVAEHEAGEFQLILGYGQSYMSLNGNNGNYSYAFDPADRVLMLDDGFDVTGGGFDDTSTTLCRFSSAVERDGVQSVVAPVAYELSRIQKERGAGLKYFVARSEAVGGGSMQELLPDSDPEYTVDNLGGAYQFGNLQKTLVKFFSECDRLGVKGKVVSIPFCQGDANRNTDYQTYYDLLSKLFDYIRAEIAQYQTAKPIFQIIIPPLSGGGAVSDCVRAQIDLAQQYDDVQLAANGSSFLRHDGLHFSSEGAIHAGVFTGHALSQFIANRAYSAPHIPSGSAEIVGNEIHLHVAGQDVQLEVDNLSPLNSYDGVNPIENYGVQWSGSESIVDVKVFPRLIKIVFDAPVAAGELKLAFQTDWSMNAGINPEDGNSPSRSNIRSTEKVFDPITQTAIHSYICPFKHTFGA